MSDEFFEEEIDYNDPYVKAWSDQMGALVRDKIRQMIKALELTGWDNMSHILKDPYDDDLFRLAFYNGEFYLINMSIEGARYFKLDLHALGVLR